MKIKLSEGFRNQLKKQVEYIAKDKPGAARKFKNDLLKERYCNHADVVSTINLL